MRGTSYLPNGTSRAPGHREHAMELVKWAPKLRASFYVLDN